MVRKIYFLGLEGESTAHESDKKRNEDNDMWGISADTGAEVNTSFDVFANAASGQGTSSAAQDNIFGDFTSTTSAENFENVSGQNSDLFGVSTPVESTRRSNGKKSKSSKKKKLKSRNKEIDTGGDLLNFSGNDGQGGVNDTFNGNNSSQTNANQSSVDALDFFSSGDTISGNSSSQTNANQSSVDASDFFSSGDTTNSSSNDLFSTLSEATQNNAPASVNQQSNMGNSNNGMLGMKNGSTYDPFAMLTNTGSVRKAHQMPPAPYFRQRPQMMSVNSVMNNRMNNLNLGFNHSANTSNGRAITNMNSMNRPPTNSVSGISSMMPMVPMNKTQLANKSSTTTKPSGSAIGKKHDPFAGLSGI